MVVASGDSQGAVAAMDRAVARAEQKTSTQALRDFVLRRAEVEFAVSRFEGAQAQAGVAEGTAEQLKQTPALGKGTIIKQSC